MSMAPRSSTPSTLPPPIPKGATIGVISFSSPLSQARLELGLDELTRLGYKIAMPLSPSAYYGKYDHGFANGSVEQRLEAFKLLLEDDSVAAILSARGGFGLMELLPHLSAPWAQTAQKPIVGLSDTTALLAQALNGFAAPMIHGPSLGDAFADAQQDAQARKSVDSLQALWHQRPWKFVAQLKERRAGEAKGRLLVGNLSMFCALLGTPWDVSFDGCVLVLEDVGESPFRLYRSLLQLALAGKFTHLQGLVFGRFAKCSAAQGPQLDDVVDLVLRQVLHTSAFPVLEEIAVGHWGENQALPIGVAAEISQGCLRVG